MMMQQQQYASSVTDPNMPVQFSSAVDAALEAYEQNPDSEETQAELLRTVERAVDLAKEMREFTNNCQREGKPLPDSFAAWHIALSKLTTQQVVNALNHIFDRNIERAHAMHEGEGAAKEGAAFEHEEAAHITLEQLRQSLKMTGDIGTQSYSSQEAYGQEQASQSYGEEDWTVSSRPLNYEEYRRDTMYRGDSTKDWLATLLLCVFTGAVGGHCFYTGRYGKGLLYLFTGGLWGLGIIYDLIKLGTGTYEDGEGNLVRNRK
ncbi:MAG: TM2 domain-containing protein [Mogibacterium sp.]|nr:TM2 domain-containing protein [Mogibacterium sp.]